MIYEPSHDSELLALSASSMIALRKPDSVLEIGVGSGFVLERLEVARKYGTDLNPAAVHATRKRVPNAHILLGDCTEPFDGPFDLIVSNPPYLPADPSDRFLSEHARAALIGGTSGVELTIRMVHEARGKLSRDGLMLVIASSHADVARLEFEFLKAGFRFFMLAQRRLEGFEDLTCYALEHNTASCYALDQDYSFSYLAHGSRSMVFSLGGSLVAKVLRSERAARHEFDILSEIDLNVPKAYRCIDDTIIMERIEATSKLTASHDKQLIHAALELDRLRIKKYEFTRPFSNVIVRDGIVYLIDFERAVRGKCGNLTQLLEHFRRRGSLSMQAMRLLVTSYLQDTEPDNSIWCDRILDAMIR